MAAIAVLLRKTFRMIRFKSKLNGRIFNLWMHDDGLYQLAELENDAPEMWVKRSLYEGEDAMKVMDTIWQEVNDVQ